MLIGVCLCIVFVGNGLTEKSVPFGPKSQEFDCRINISEWILYAVHQFGHSLARRQSRDFRQPGHLLFQSNRQPKSVFP